MFVEASIGSNRKSSSGAKCFLATRIFHSYELRNILFDGIFRNITVLRTLEKLSLLPTPGRPHDSVMVGKWDALGL